MIPLIISFFYLWIIHLFFTRFFLPKKKNMLTIGIIWSVFYLFQCFILNRFDLPVINFITSYIALLILCRCLYESSYKSSIFLCLIGYTGGMLIEILVALVIAFLGGSITETALEGSILSKFILLILLYITAIIKKPKQMNEPTRIYWILLLGTAASSVVIIHTVFSFVQVAVSKSQRVLCTFTIIILLLLNMMILFVLYYKLSQATDLYIQNIRIKEQFNHFQEAAATKKSQDSLLKIEKHNLKNQLIAIRAYAINQQTDNIINFVNKLLDENQYGLSRKAFTDNLIIDTLLLSKKNLAEEKGVILRTDLYVPEILPYDDIDLCVLLGNIMDNAIEACINCTSGSPFVDTTIRYKNDCLFIHVKNPYVHILQPSGFSLFNSTKSDFLRHGYGLQSVQNIVNKYNGEIHIETKGNLFSLRLTLYSQLIS